MKRLLGAVILALLAVLAGAPNALADTVCTGGNGLSDNQDPDPDNDLTGSHDNVVVPAGAKCDLRNAQVKGNVKVYGELNVFAPTTISGNIEAEPGHKWVRLWGGAVEVKGNVLIKGAQAGAFESGGFLPGIKIGGNFYWEGNPSPLVAMGATINGDLKMEGSTGGGGLAGNYIQGNLQCKGNNPKPVNSGPVNTVLGNREDQCAGL